MDDVDQGRGLASIVSLIGLLLSAIVVVAGLVWNGLGRPEHVWTESQAREYTEARNALHAASHEHEHEQTPAKSAANRTNNDAAQESHSAVDSPKYKEARARFDRVRHDLEDARYAKNEAGHLLVRFGLVAAACCGVAFMVTRRA